MDNLYIDYFFFFVPNRLVWDNWEKFNGAQDNPGDSTSFIIPTLTTTAVTGEVVGSIYDKFGIPTQVPGLVINSLPFRAYMLCYNEWFRDQNLINSVTVPTDDGPDVPSDFYMLKRAYVHYCFTSCLPWPREGTAVSMPLGISAPVVRNSAVPAWTSYVTGTNTLNTAGALSANGSGQIAGAGGLISLDPGTNGLSADLSAATAATINQLRQAMQVQSILELDARGGTRYVEILQAHFNVVSPDFRLQRPEYLGGGSSRINIHPIAQTSPTSGANPQAQLASFGTSSATGGNIGFTKSFVEHGYVIGMACARADVTYQQGLERMWSKSTRFDFFWPKLQEIGEQAVLNKEIYAQGTADPTADAAAFGYQERYAEYRYKPSQIKGEFRSTYATSLDTWHLAQEFGSLPALNGTFINQDTPVDRVTAVPTEPHLLIDYWFQYKHARPMLTYSVPSTLGKF